MSIDTLPFLRYDYFKIWKSKTKVVFQGHIVGSTFYWLASFCSILISLPIPEILWPWKVNVIGEDQKSWSHSGSSISLTYIPFVPCQSAFPFLRYGYLKNWPWKSKVKVMGEVQVQGPTMGPTSYQLTFCAFDINQNSHSWDVAISKFTLKIQDQVHGWGQRPRSHSGFENPRSK